MLPFESDISVGVVLDLLLLFDRWLYGVISEVDAEVELMLFDKSHSAKPDTIEDCLIAVVGYH